MYKIKINLKYGNFSIKADNYQECMTKYHEIKEEYANIPSEITVYKGDKIQFVKHTGEKSFESLYNNLIDNLIEIGKYQVEMTKNENTYGNIKNKLYHELEELDLGELEETKQLEFLINMKNQLTKRRITENENRKLYAFDKAYNTILDALSNYIQKEKPIKDEASIKRYNDVYYTETNAKKKEKIKKLHNLKIK